MLHNNELIDEELKVKLEGMVGFRNIAVHNYLDVELKIVQQIIEKHLKDLDEFKKTILNLL